MEFRLFVGDVPLIFLSCLTPPSVNANASAWLNKVSGYSLSARSQAIRAAGTAEAASITVELDNAERQASELVGQPLRARGEVYNDDGSLYFSGLVQSIDYGTVLVFGIET